MMSRSMFAAALILMSACGDSTKPATLGPLDSRIIEGDRQAGTAGGTPPARVVELVFRNELALAPKSRLDWMLPTFAFAQSVTIHAQPNSVACVGEEQHDLVPKTRCVNTDSVGQSRFDWIAMPTKVGTYKALLNATYGLEATTFDTVTIVVAAGPADSSAFIDNFSPRTSPAGFGAALSDKFGNSVPYRIPADARLTPQDTVLGSAGARTVVFSAGAADGIWRTVFLTGNAGAPIGQFTYKIALDNGVPKIFAAICGVKVSPCESVTWK